RGASPCPCPPTGDDDDSRLTADRPARTVAPTPPVTRRRLGKRGVAMSRSTLRHGLRWVGLLGSLVVVAGCGSTTSPTAAPAGAAPSVAAVAPPTAPPPAVDCTATPIKFDTAATKNLTGLYAADDGGIYYLRQRGNVVWWSGMSDREGPADELGRTWNNVGRG